jgi:hypothetical protein
MNWQDYVPVVYYLPLMLLGLLLHITKKKIKGESWSAVKAYFTTHLVTTVSGILTGLALLFMFKAVGELSVASAILAGYATNSMFQKQMNAAAGGLCEDEEKPT